MMAGSTDSPARFTTKSSIAWALYPFLWSMAKSSPPTRKNGPHAKHDADFPRDACSFVCSKTQDVENRSTHIGGCGVTW
jgi:hypothetical protein